MTEAAFLGHKVRRLRLGCGLSQVQAAARLGISPSYLNLIEHNRRTLTLSLAIKVARAFDADIKEFSDDDEQRLIPGLTEVFGDPLFGPRRVSQGDLGELANILPAVGHGIMELYAAYRMARDNIRALGERLSDDSFPSTTAYELRTLSTSIRSFSEILHDNVGLAAKERRKFLEILVGESEKLTAAIGRLTKFAETGGLGDAAGLRVTAKDVLDFIEGHDNYFPDIEEEAQALRRETIDVVETDDAGPGMAVNSGLGRGLARILLERHGVETLTVPWDGQSEMACFVKKGGKGKKTAPSAGGGRLSLSEIMPPASAAFHMAHRIGLIRLEGLFRDMVSPAGLAGEAGQAAGCHALANYFAGAVLMPYGDFLKSAHEMRYDIELLQRRFAVTFEQACHRLTTLRRPGNAGVPFHFIRVDIAGNISKRFNGSGLHIPLFGGACPRWNVHAAFMSPGAILTQLVRMPDGAAYFCLARAVTKPGGGYGSPGSPSGTPMAIGIGCGAAQARNVVYADGLDLENLEAAVPVGSGCRLCERETCRQRAFPSLIQSQGGENGGQGRASYREA